MRTFRQSVVGRLEEHLLKPFSCPEPALNPCYLPRCNSPVRRPRRWMSNSTTPLTSLTRTTRYSSTQVNARSTPSNSAVPRTAISLLGSTNAGKSVLMNLLTQSDVSLVHGTAGTTADPKICAMELHGRIGPVRLLDTPGIDEAGDLGALKRERAFQTIGQCDVAVIVVDPFAPDQSVPSTVDLLNQVEIRQGLNRLAQNIAERTKPDDKCIGTAESAKPTGVSLGKNSRPTPIPLLVYNLRQDKVRDLELKGGSVSELMDDVEKKIIASLQESHSSANNPPFLPPTLAVDFTAVKASRDRVINFLERYVSPRPESVTVLPDQLVDTHLQGHTPAVFLNIPMDQQTPGMRLLRPQAMIQEALIRQYVASFCYRMDLNMARSENPIDVQTEKDRFLRALDPLLSSGDLSLLITDSQAIDVVAPWTLDSESGEEIVPITTFSIAMIRYLSGGRLGYFADGLRKLDQMVAGEVSPKGDKWRVLITEACNHTRLNMEKECADIGTVQLPNHLTRVLGGESAVDFEYAFGKHVAMDPTRYDLVVHCGGCMLNPQQMDARVADLLAAGVPATNYGLLLSRIQSPQTLSRVLKPWGIDYGSNHSVGDEKEHPSPAAA